MHLMAIIAVSLLVSEKQVIQRLILTFYKDGQTGAGKSYSMVCVWRITWEEKGTT